MGDPNRCHWSKEKLQEFQASQGIMTAATDDEYYRKNKENK